MCDSMRHRGPDDEGRLVKGRIGLGMRRLSIIDLAGGRQPIFNEDGSKAVVMNGEIYNYRELRGELEGRGHRLRTRSDTETIVHLYEELGANCVSRLRGMFAFALWDETDRTLLLARDRFGIKPLYIASEPGQLAFASELKSLRAVGAGGHSLDWNAIDAYFQLGYVPSPYSPFKGIRKLQPGHLLVWKEDGVIRDRQYWDLPVREQPPPQRLTEKVLEWVDESVSSHLVADVPVAALLSGGLDSSAVVASMASSGTTPHAYTARFRGSGAGPSDETGLAAALAQRYGVNLTRVDVEPQLTELLEPTVWALDEPLADESAIPTWLLSQRIAEDYKVVLAGTGGDELFAGYRRYVGLLLSTHYTRLPASLRSALVKLTGLLPEPRGGGLGIYRLKRFVATAPGSAMDRYLDLLNRLPDMDHRALLVADVVDQLGRSAAEIRFSELYDAADRPEGLKAALYVDYRTYLPDDILHLSDRIAMAHSLEVRVPFVDHELVERVFPLSDRVKIGRGRAKYLLRKALAGRLPRQHFRAPKRGFVGPTASWLRNELRDLLLDELSPARVARLGFLDPKVVGGLTQDHLSGRHNRESVLWALLSFSIWHRLYVEDSVAPRCRDRQSRRIANQ